MAPRYCPQCGAPSSPSAAFCQYCGTALPPVPSSPLPSSGASGVSPPPPAWSTPPPAGPAYTAPPYGAPVYGAPPYATPPPARPKRRLWLWIIVGFVVFFLVIAAVGYLLLPSAPAINVTEITFASSDDACGLENSAWEGFTANESQSLYLGFNLTGPANSSGGTLACKITTVNSTTTGFSVSGANVPLTIPANTNETLEFNVTCPSSPFNGALTVSVT
jgi:hypothetical protein